MRPGARLQAAIEVLDAWHASGGGLDHALLRWGRARRFAGSGDRRAVGDIAYDVARRARSLQWLAGGGDPGGDLARFDPRRAVLARTRLVDPAALADLGAPHAPAPLSTEERRALDALDPERRAARLAGAPRGVRLDLPDWLLDRLGAVPETALDALGERAPLDLRANRSKASREEAARRLAGEGVTTVSAPLAPDALRVVDGARRVAASAAYTEGLVEIQDAASQATALLAAPAAGGAVLDYCAGGGGKILALAAAVGGRGRFVAHDAAPGRMADLPARAARAGVSLEIARPGDLEGAARFDLVFVDAPCSGSGTWRREPDARWRLTPERLDALTALQDRVLSEAAGYLRPGGTLAYATCSLLAEEGEARVDAFLERQGGFVEDARRRFLPGRERGDGFFAARLSRS
ncbi:MAG: RsmB/NOP family class I SAM-dependent RNA methyltransferase [Paracoccaceae bacterium]